MIYSGYTAGIEGRIVRVASEPSLVETKTIAGLTENAARECLVRVRASLVTGDVAEVAGVKTGIALTSATRFMVTEQLSRLESWRNTTCDVGLGIDLPIALEALRAAGAPLPDDLLAIGYLSLGGHVRPVRGVLPVLLAGYRQGLRLAVIPEAHVGEATLAQRVHPDLRICVASSLVSAITQLVSGRLDEFVPHVQPLVDLPTLDDLPDAFDTVRREVIEAVRRQKPILLVGDRGAPMTMIARRVVRLLRPMTLDERIETACVASAAGLPVHPYMERPLRAPHHTASSDAILGSRSLRPGEVTLAHRGVLYLDELTEFRRSTIEALALTLKQGSVTFRRRLSNDEPNVTMPAKPYLVASVNPCPCGVSEACTCTFERKVRHLSRIEPLRSSFVEIHVPRLTTAQVYPARA